jgi:hypothetical protein
MPIEILAGWLLSEACKLFIVPIADGVRKQFVDEASKEIAAPLMTTVFGPCKGGKHRRGQRN